MIRWSDAGSFSILPEWLLDAEVSDRAVRLYAVLARYADRDGHAMPGRRALAARLRCAISTLDVALRELVEAGALTIAPRERNDGSRTSNDYLLHVAPRQVPTGEPVAPPTETPVGGLNENQIEREGTAIAVPGETPDRSAPPPLVRIGGRDVALDALAEVCGIDDAGTRYVQAAIYLNGPRHRVTKKKREPGIVDLFWLECSRWANEHNQPERLVEAHDHPDLWAQALATRIRTKAATYRAQLNGATISPKALRDWWLDMEKQPRHDGGLTVEGMLNLDA